MPITAAYFRYLRSQPLKTFAIPCDIVKQFFLSMLTSQLERDVGDVSQNIEEMTVHCCELLTSNIPQPVLERAVRALVSAYHSQLKQSSLLGDSDKVIKCL